MEEILSSEWNFWEVNLNETQSHILVWIKGKVIVVKPKKGEISFLESALNPWPKDIN